MRLRCLLSLCFLLSAALPAHAGLIAYWNFNTLNIPTAAAPGSGGVPTSIAATSGSGSLNLATWGGTVDDFVGSTLNTLNSDPAGASLSLIVGGTSAPFPGNNSFITFSTSLTGNENPILSFATRGTSTGFNSGIWSWSLDGSSFTAIPGVNTATTSTTFATTSVDLSSINALDNAATVFFRYTLSGGTNATGNNRIDNFQINASQITAVPEPTSMALLGVALAGGLLRKFRRKKPARA